MKFVSCTYKFNGKKSGQKFGYSTRRTSFFEGNPHRLRMSVRKSFFVYELSCSSFFILVRIQLDAEGYKAKKTLCARMVPRTQNNNWIKKTCLLLVFLYIRHFNGAATVSRAYDFFEHRGDETTQPKNREKKVGGVIGCNLQVPCPTYIFIDLVF